jgi:tRNA-2-methylthio-N6-dimethylallyladenosine synthase
MQGCKNYCSYCIVPYVRGPELSREPAELVREVINLVYHGVKEITLLGQNVNAYGKTLSPKNTFPELLATLNEIKGLQRIRFITSHPKDLSPELISSIKDLEKVCEHIHLPLQAGSNRILTKMNRGYRHEEYLAKINTLRKAVPEVCITSDIIVGFPGETNDDFEETLAVVEEVCFDDLFSFRYSDRPGTIASALSDKVPDDIMSNRLTTLQEKQRKISLARNKMLLGKVLPVLFEGPSRKSPERLAGRTRTNKIVNCRASANLIGSTVQVKIEKANIHSLLGTIV